MILRPPIPLSPTMDPRMPNPTRVRSSHHPRSLLQLWLLGDTFAARGALPYDFCEKLPRTHCRPRCRGRAALPDDWLLSLRVSGDHSTMLADDLQCGKL